MPDSSRRRNALWCPSGRLLAGLAAGFALTGPAQGEIYRWVDDQGRVTYTDTLPKGREISYRKVDVVVPQGKADPQARGQAVAADERWATRIEWLEKQLDDEKQARAAADARAAVAQAGYEQRIADVAASRALIPVVSGPLWVVPGGLSRHPRHLREGQPSNAGSQGRDPGVRVGSSAASARFGYH